MISCAQRISIALVACDIWNWYKPSQSTSLASQESLGTRSLAFDEAQLYAHPSNEPMNLDNANRLRPLYSDRGKLPGLYSPQLTVYRTISTSQVDSMVAVEGTLDTFDSILSSFVWPDRLDFLLARGRKRPELANTPHNALWIDQREKLCGLVVELQGILTHGSTKIHEARNDAISLIRSELSSLDEYEIRLWQKV